jgi:aminopeptidase-like protein
LNQKVQNTGQEIYQLARELYPICRSISGEGVRRTLGIIKRELPDLILHSVPTGTACFDWTVPQEWNVTDAYIETPDGDRICCFQDHNLHLVGYSTPVNLELSLDELQPHLNSLPDQPDAIPYVTSYYKKDWGFCLTDYQRRLLKDGIYRIVIQTTLEDGVLNYGELLIPPSQGGSEEEILLSTYVCHPSMGNNELSGPCVTTYLAKWLSSLKQRRYGYRIVFVPETIGSILYISRNLQVLKKRIIAGFNITCVGDDRTYSFLPTRGGNTLADAVARHVLENNVSGFEQYDWSKRGSDERQYCAPGVNLPVTSIARSKFGTYSEYHTSLDDLSLISPEGLGGAYEVHKACLEILEIKQRYRTTVICEPMMSKHGLYPTTSKVGSVSNDIRLMMDILTYGNGHCDLVDVANLTGRYALDLYPAFRELLSAGLVELIENKKDR